jgi:alpha-D-ribose 1-methylphosphonate 5-triphosphate diphosphatase
MTQEQIFINAQVVTNNKVLDGTVCTRDGEIVDIAEGRSDLSSVIDLDGDYLLPGFVELHTDNLEKHFSPRPGVVWPPVPAALAHDVQIAAAGITTVFDALAVGDLNEDSARLQNLSNMSDAIHEAGARNLLRADHMIHLRCEVSHSRSVEIFADCVDKGHVRLASLMDHTPGQRQFTCMATYKRYYQGKYGMTDEELARFVEEKRESQERYSAPHRATIVEECRARGITMASHDDATVEHVDEAIGNGVTISEFPTTVEAASKAHAAGLSVLMGSPNLVLGGSHSGNVSAMDLAEGKVLDILSSDYVPSSMIHGVFMLWQSGAKATLSDAVATVSRTPARAVGLDDRGEIAVGKRADLVRVSVQGDTPTVVSVWREGQRII